MEEFSKDSAQVEKTNLKLKELGSTMKDLLNRQDALEEKQDFMLNVEKKMDQLSNMLERTEARISQVNEGEEKVKRTQHALGELEIVINRTNLEKAKIDNELIESLNEGLRAFGEASTQLNETISAASGISEYNSQIQEGVKNMNALNSLYELQLQASNQQMEATTVFLQNLQSSVEDSKRFQEQVSQLAVNLEQMNKVYGNMLTAMNPNK